MSDEIAVRGIYVDMVLAKPVRRAVLRAALTQLVCR